MNSCNKCLYNNDDICQNDKCSFDSEDNCYEFEDISTYNKGYQQGRADLLTEFKEQGAYDIIRADEREKSVKDFAEWLAKHSMFCDCFGVDLVDAYGIENTVELILDEYKKELKWD